MFPTSIGNENFSSRETSLPFVMSHTYCFAISYLTIFSKQMFHIINAYYSFLSLHFKRAVRFYMRIARLFYRFRYILFRFRILSSMIIFFICTFLRTFLLQLFQIFPEHLQSFLHRLRRRHFNITDLHKINGVHGTAAA